MITITRRRRPCEEALEEALELDTQSQIFLEMRRQNLDLLRLATEVAGYSGSHGPLKSGDVKGALRNIWDVFSEFYAWIDPEEAEGDDETTRTWRRIRASIDSIRIPERLIRPARSRSSLIQPRPDG